MIFFIAKHTESNIKNVTEREREGREIKREREREREREGGGRGEREREQFDFITAATSGGEGMWRG